MSVALPTLEEIRAALREEMRSIIREELERLAPANSPDDLLTTSEAAAFAKVEPETVATWCRSGKLHAGARPYRVRRSDLLSFLARREPDAPDPVAATLHKLRR